MVSTTITKKMDDYSLEEVPHEDRHSWLKISWNTAGIVTTLIQLFFGALVAFVAGIKIALISGFIVITIGTFLGWAVGHVGYKTGLSSTLMSRVHGLGTKGSIIASLIFGFMIIGFLALENALLYKGFLFFLNLEDTLSTKIIIYGLLTVTWILLTGFGFELVAKVASFMLITFLLVLAWMLIDIVGVSDHSLSQMLTYDSQMPAQVLAKMHIESSWDKYIFCINVMIGSIGALALLDGDFGRYARSSKDIGIAALIACFAQSGLMLIIGAVVMYAGMNGIVEYFVETRGLSVAEAKKLALQSPDSVASTFIIFGGITGTILMILAQAKAQVLNTYSGSLSLTNLFDAAFKWRPGRFIFVILANFIGLFMLYGQILEQAHHWIKILGVITTALVGVIIADYYIVRRILGHEDTKTYGAETVNWAGIVTVITGSIAAHYILNRWIPIEFFTSLFFALVLYPLLRLYILKPRQLDLTTPSGSSG